MKRSLLLFILPVSLLASAQTHHGPKLGVGMATINVQLFQWNGLPKFGPIAGYSFDMYLNKQVSVLLEPMYVGKGSLVQNAQVNQWTSTTLNYAEIPLLVKISTNKDEGGLFITGGLVAGYLVSGRVRTTQEGNELFNRPFDLKNNTRRTQFSVAVGMGYQMGRWEIELRGENSITPFDPVVRLQNLLVGLQLCYRFPPRPPKPEVDEDEIDG